MNKLFAKVFKITKRIVTTIFYEVIKSLNGLKY